MSPQVSEHPSELEAADCLCQRAIGEFLDSLKPCVAPRRNGIRSGPCFPLTSDAVPLPLTLLAQRFRRTPLPQPLQLPPLSRLPLRLLFASSPLPCSQKTRMAMPYCRYVAVFCATREQSTNVEEHSVLLLDSRAAVGAFALASIFRASKQQ